MNEPRKQGEPYPDEITLRELVLSTAHLIKWLKKHVLRLLLFGVIFGALGALWAKNQQESYTAHLSFILSDDNNPQISGLGSMLGQLGFPSTGGRYNVDKLLEIAKSRLLIERTLLEESKVNSTTDLIANHMIEYLDMDDIWSKKDPAFEGYRFTNTNDSLFSDLDRFAIKSLVQTIAGSKDNRKSALFTTDYGNTDYIMTFSLNSPSEGLSMAFVNHHYDNVSDHYVSRAVAKNRAIYNLILNDRDSLITLVNQTAFEAATLKDQSAGSFRNTDNAKIALAETKLRTLQSALEEVITNLGRAQYILDTNSPLIQLIDRPKSPLSPLKPSVFKYSIAAALIGICLYFLTIFGRLVIKEV